ncbi:cytidine deaminase [Treponema phagedenis]|uniref:Cytidine deaminase n=1 Tax=Treponema phagedenis TaxID=162 RepID=A0A0B7GU27_TREPH|nr:cytidine deaminase [Treponema phagedenis]EFW37269.1 cytidine deaminase [Treponema phagedenis F0421]NVP23741.1 cytidine deaminase [Treponema phagedenis]QEJ94439.1 cytidine deaminase [Treponema phagedenis]QEJ97503.1 cytidine deaminase [Treponema phagedenis]QEK01680.1 cytidine deaminase [Treponema phagedenis]
MEISREYLNLFEEAAKAAQTAYCPYSNFHVGAALLLDDGSVITGINIENRSYGLSNCAERTALFKAISMGKKDFKAIAIATPDANYPVGPCGACRQVISEFMDKKAVVLFGSEKQNIVYTTVEEIYPFDSLHELGKNN